MAKRKRLNVASPVFPDTPGGGTVSIRAPIADVTGDSAASAALAEVTAELTRARETGRMIVSLPLDAIDQAYLVRDRLAADDEEMAALVASIRDRGQQSPIEVVALGGARYGLISGWRRCQAIARLRDWGVGDGMVLALERTPETATDAYRAMIEENEIRVGLSYFERARIVDVAVEQGIFDSHKKALQSLFSSASRSKRSKIGSFVIVVQLLGDRLAFPMAIGERLGLRLARLLDLYPDKARALCTDLALVRQDTSEAELAYLTAWAARAEAEEKDALSATRTPRPAPVETRLGSDLHARYHTGENRLELSGAGLTAELRAELISWLAAQLD